MFKNMMNRTRRFISLVLVFAMALSFMQITVPLGSAMAVTSSNQAGWGGNVQKDADPVTWDEWKTLFSENSTVNAGTVWTDKSVFTGADATELAAIRTSIRKLKLGLVDTDSFIVALSAMGATKSVYGQKSQPTDTIFVLDVSGSMLNDTNAVDNMITALNTSMARLFALNPNNRVGVVLYASYASTILPLNSYDASGSNGTYFTVEENWWNDSVYIRTAQGLKVLNGNTVSQTSREVVGGTYIQSGIDAAADILVAASGKTNRTPVMVLMTDGVVTFADSDWANPSADSDDTDMGTGSYDSEVFQNELDFVTQLTAAYAKHRVKEAYGEDALLYTMGFGDSDDISESVLNPNGVTNATIDAYWAAIKNTTASTMNITSTWSDRWGTHSETWSISTGITSNGTKVFPVDDSDNYVKLYNNAPTSDQITSMFETILDDIALQTRYSLTAIGANGEDFDGYVTFTDTIGEYMDVKDVKGLVIGDVLYTGAALSMSFAEGNVSFSHQYDLGDLDGTLTAYGEGFINAVETRLGLERNEAIALVKLAKQYKQLHYQEVDGESIYSNYIGWYADVNGNYLGFYDENFAAEDPVVSQARYVVKSYGYIDPVAELESNMLFCVVQVRTDLQTNRQEVIWKVPASLLPTAHYNIKMTGSSLDDPGTITVEYEAAEPIRLLFEVGLREDIKVYNIVEKLDRHNHANGVYRFYTNDWNQTQTEKINTHSWFVPNEENDRYYATADLLLYTETANGYVPYSASAGTPDASGTYYTESVMFVNVGGTWERSYAYFPISPILLEQGNDNFIVKDGNWYLKKGVSYPAISTLNHDKITNVTGSLEEHAYSYSENHTEGTIEHFHEYVALGNNGILRVTPSTGIEIIKTVQEVIGNPSFDFEITGLDANTVYKSAKTDVNGNVTEGTVTSNANGVVTVTLGANERFFIVGLVAGREYTVTEVLPQNSEYACVEVEASNVADATVNGNAATVLIGEWVAKVKFTNEYVDSNDVIIEKITDIPDSGITTDALAHLMFGFRVTLDTTGVATGGDLGTEITANVGGTDKTLQVNTDNSGNYTVNFELASSQQAVLKDIPVGTKVTVEEIKVGSVPMVDGVSSNGWVNITSINTTTVSNQTINKVTITNQYQPTMVYPVNVELYITKNLEGREWKTDDRFFFSLERRMLADQFQIVGQLPATSSNKTVDFSAPLQALEFTKAGTYTYRITEIPGDIGGVTYNPNAFYFYIVVDDMDMNGQYEIVNVYGTDANVTVTKTNNNYVIEAEYTNTYAATGSATATIRIQKNILDASGTPISNLDEFGLSLEGFEFGIYNVNVVDGEYEFGSLITTVTSDADGEIDATLSVTAADIGKTYYYGIKEIRGGISAITYDTTEHVFSVTAVDNGDGTISAMLDNKLTQAVENAEELAFEFNNVFNPGEPTVEIGGIKEMTGRRPLAGEFEFELWEADSQFNITGNAPVKTATNDADGAFSITTNPLPLENMQETYYYFVVKEKQGNLPGVTYDPAEWQVTVKVSPAQYAQNNGAEASIERVVKKGGATTPADVGIVFTNEYDATGVALFRGLKELDGRDITADEFEILLYRTGSNWSINGLTPVLTAKVNANGRFAFDAIQYDIDDVKAGRSFYYVIVEKNAGQTIDGVTYDSKEYRVQVTLSDNGDGTLNVVKTINGTVDGAIIFNNDYVAEDETFDITIDKTVTSDVTLPNGLTKEGFVFGLYDENNVRVGDYVVTDANGEAEVTIQIDNTNGAAVGKTFYYTLKEVADPFDGKNVALKYDGSVYQIKLDVADDGEGKLIVDYEVTKIIGSDGAAIAQPPVIANGVLSDNTNVSVAFENVYDPSNVYFTVAGHKTLIGKAVEAGEFEFGIWKAEVRGSQWIKVGDAVDTAFNDKDGEFRLDLTTEPDEGKIYYVIVEEIIPATKLDYITYDTSRYLISYTLNHVDGVYGINTIKVTKETVEGGNTVQTEINVPGAFDPNNPVYIIDFVNTYTPEPIDVVIEGTKELIGRELEDGEFTFQLKNLSGSVLDTADNGAANANNIAGFEFAPIQYTHAGIYTYTVNEVKGNLGGVTYDETVYTVVVTITDNGDGTLSSSVDYTVGNEEKTELAFVNEYDAEDLDIDGLVSIKKLISNPQGVNHNVTPEGFKFGLYDASGALVGTYAVTDDNGETSFDLQLKAEDAGRTLVYTVKEYVSSFEGVNRYLKYDESQYTISITVIDNLDGTLGYRMEIKKTVDANGDAISAPVVINGTELEFTNVYDPGTINLALRGIKTLTGRDLKANEFEFAVFGATVNGNTWTEGSMIDSGKNDADGYFYVAIEMAASLGQKYYYIVRELIPADKLGGVTYDETRYLFEVTIGEKFIGGENTGEIGVAEVICYKETADGTRTLIDIPEQFDLNNPVYAITFNNVYTPKYLEVPIYATKNILGRHFLDSDVFTFKIEVEGEEPSAYVLQNIEADSSIEFLIEKLGFAKAEDIVVTISEVSGTIGGMTYDDTIYTVEISVTDDGEGNLSADVKYYVGNDRATEIEFTNKYKATTPAEITLFGHKTLVGKILEANMFEFILANNDGYTDEVTNAAPGPDGKGKFEFATLTFDEVGTYYYTVTETEGNMPGVEYDGREYTVTITVTDNFDGTLSATASYGVENSSASSIEFENTYDKHNDPTIPKPTITVEIQGIKEFKGNSLDAGDFEFVLKDKDGKVIQKVTNTAEGNFKFTLEGLEVGVYEFTMNELKGKDVRVIYDETVYTVAITVAESDVTEDELVATTKINGKALGEVEVKFVNVYDPELGEAPIYTWLILAILSFFGLVLTFVYDPKRRKFVHKH